MTAASFYGMIEVIEIMEVHMILILKILLMVCKRSIARTL